MSAACEVPWCTVAHDGGEMMPGEHMADPHDVIVGFADPEDHGAHRQIDVMPQWCEVDGLPPFVEICIRQGNSDNLFGRIELTGTDALRLCIALKAAVDAVAATTLTNAQAFVAQSAAMQVVQS